MEEITEKKTESIPDNDVLLTEWAEKIYRASESTWKILISFLNFPQRKDAEKFRNEMCGKNFGGFVSVLQSNAGLLYLKIGDHAMDTTYFPAYCHIEKIKKFLSEQRENTLEAVQQIIMQIAIIPIVARMIRGKILYPEIAEMEKEIAELKAKIKEKNKQLRFSLDTLLYLAHGIDSDIRNTLPRIYAILNEIGKE